MKCKFSDDKAESVPQSVAPTLPQEDTPSKRNRAGDIVDTPLAPSTLMVDAAPAEGDVTTGHATGNLIQVVSQHKSLCRRWEIEKQKYAGMSNEEIYQSVLEQSRGMNPSDRSTLPGRHYSTLVLTAQEVPVSPNFPISLCSTKSMTPNTFTTPSTDVVLVSWSEAHEVLAVSFLSEGDMSAGSGCARSVSGPKGRQGIRKLLAPVVRKGVKMPRIEHFKFGDGKTVDSFYSMQYPVFINGANCGHLEMAYVECPCPPLLSERLMEEWKVNMDFDKKAMFIR